MLAQELKRTYKDFSQDLHDKYDKLGRDAATEHFKCWGMTLTPHPNTKDVDFIMEDGTILDVEIRTKWSGPVFPLNYKTVHFLARKGKYLDQKFLMMFISIDTEYAMLLREYQIKDCPIVHKPNYLNRKEYVYEVPRDRGLIIKLRRSS